MHSDRTFAGQFVFGDFVLKSEGVLSRGGKETRLPPKETLVLLTLVKSAGELVSKDALLDAVWGAESVGEESLTRCIYTLRRLLGETRDDRYIETVYGKGFRFNRVATFMPAAQRVSQCSLAILPFQISGFDSLAVHGSLIHKLSRLGHYGVHVVPAVMSREATSSAGIHALLEKVAPDYYLAGETVQRGGNRLLKLELVRSSDHALVSSHTLLLVDGMSDATLIQRIAAELPGQIPGFVPSRALPSDGASLDVMLSCQQARRYLRQPSRRNLDHALHYFQMALGADPGYAPAHCGVAEVYLALASLGYLHVQDVMERTRQALETAETLDPKSPLLLAVKGWYWRFAEGDTDAAEQCFHEALSIGAPIAELHYYYACHLVHEGRRADALAELERCLAIDSGMDRARIETIWVLFHLGRFALARETGEALLRTSPCPGPAVYAALAVVLMMQGDAESAVAMARRIGVEEEDALWLSACHAWVMASVDPDRVAGLIPALLDEAGREPPMLSVFLPVVRLLGGPDAARSLEIRAEAAGCRWLGLMRADPRLSDDPAMPAGESGRSRSLFKTTFNSEARV
ncbi:winged helix-turn-helix domain-containing protein [Paludibacterium paludis]|uniref:Transcriptional regulator HilA n=1 Tax=Paludibacterium paludis TaxID=1225769 RepID=A0A918UBH3_9NEIS|nr:winged helix-turn-helix domain-containing protein [Paludibacterium paludis]GGY23906.1 transcriptional regulator HilA [Paludibacterium paludis]